MPTFTYSGEVPDDTDSLVVAEVVQALPIGFCSRHIHLRQVVFSSSCKIHSIPDNAFRHCTGLRHIDIPSTVKTIGDFAFEDCSSLSEFGFPEGLKTIGKNSFSVCGVFHLRIPGSLAVIEECSFSGCNALLHVELSAGLKVIGEEAFTECPALQEMRLPPTVEVIGRGAFADCSSLQAVDLPKGLKKIGEYAFDQACNLQSIAIPSSVEYIEEFAFSGCLRLQVVRLELGLEIIGAGAFRHCSALSRVSIPQTVENIGDEAFEHCTFLREVVFVDGSLNLIGTRAFADCYLLSSIYIPSSVGYVGEAAFDACSNLISVEIPQNSRTEFGRQVFRECQLLSNIALPTSTRTQYDILDDCAYAYGSAFQGVKSRFRGYPVHEACYYAASTESDEMLVSALRMQGENNTFREENLIDPLGMTPFHVLMSAAKKRPDLLLLLLEFYQSNVLGFIRPNGDTALEYLVEDWNVESSRMLRMALDKWMIDGMQSWGLPQWRSKMSELTEFIFRDDLNMVERMRIIPPHLTLEHSMQIRPRCIALHKAWKQMIRYELMEGTSLVEMWLWKMKMQSMRNGAKRVAVDRESSRARCGATFVIPTIVDYFEVLKVEN